MTGPAALGLPAEAGPEPRAKGGGCDTWGSSIMRMESWSALALLDGIHTATAAQNTKFHAIHRVDGKIASSPYVL